MVKPKFCSSCGCDLLDRQRNRKRRKQKKKIEAEIKEPVRGTNINIQKYTPSRARRSKVAISEVEIVSTLGNLVSPAPKEKTLKIVKMPAKKRTSKRKPKIKFEDSIDIISEEIKKRKGKWTLTSIAWMDFEDISQILKDTHIQKVASL